jgi:hypothetical protein
MLQKAGIVQPVQRLCYELGDRGVVVLFPAGKTNVSLLHKVRTGSGAHTASCTIGTGGGGCFPEDKAAGT